MEYHEIIQNGLVKGQNGQPFAQKTSLGWLIQGKTSSPSTSDDQVISISMLTESTSTLDLEKQIAKFWELEQTNSSIPQNPNEIRCEQLFQSSIKRCDDGHYMVALPFKTGINPCLGDSRRVALRRLYNLQLKMEKNISLP